VFLLDFGEVTQLGSQFTLMTVLVPLATLLAVRLLPRSSSLHFCRLVSFPTRVNLFGSSLPAWYGWDFVLICPVATFPLTQRGFLVLNMLSTLSVLNTHFLLLGNWPVSWGRLFLRVLCLGTSPVSCPDIPILIFCVALLGITKFPCRLPP